MASNEKRTLQITAQLKDFVSKNVSLMGRGIAAFARGAGKAFSGLFRLVSPLSLAVSGFAAAWASFKGGKTIAEVLDGVDALNKLGDSVGTNVDRVALLKGAFELGGASGEEFEQIIKSVSKAVGGVVDKESKQLIEAFERLGISVEDLKRLDVVEVFDRIALGLERYGTAQERAGALARILPSQFQPLFASLANGQEEFRKLIATAQLFIGTVSEAGAAAAGRFADSLFLIRTAAQSVGRDAFIRIAEVFAPTLERLAVFLANNRELIANGIAALVTAITKGLATIASLFVKLAAIIVGGLDDLFDFLRDKSPLIGQLLASAFDIQPLSDSAKAIKAEAKGIAKEIVEAQRKIAEIRSLPGEFDPLGDRLPQLEQRSKDLRNQLASLANEFDQIAPGQGDLVQSSLDGASLRQLSEFLDQLSNLQDLPGLPSDFAPMFRAVFGAGGPQEARSEMQNFFDGFSEQMEKVRDQWTDFGQAGREAATTIVDGGLDGISGALVDGITRTKSWNQAWKDLARSTLADLARIIVKLAIVRTLSAVGFGTTGVALEKGGVVQGNMGKPVQAFASGGVTNGPTLALFGEGRNREAFVPLPDNRSIPVTLSGNTGGQVFNISISAMDGRDVRRVLVEQQSTIAAIFRNQVENRVGMRQVIQRAGA